MKFVIAVVLLALAMSAQSSIIPLSVAHSPILLAAPAHAPASVAVHASVRELALPAIHTVSALHQPAILGLPSLHAAAIPAVLPAALPAAVQVLPHAAPIIAALPAAEGTYVAKTRGAVHVAPLPGHAQSASSVNLEPAPGTL